MRYLGGKTRIAKQIAKIISQREASRKLLIEPFMGAGNVTAVLAPLFDLVVANDVHEDLMLMWNALAAGWIPPDKISEQEYKQLKYEVPSALRGFAGFACSFAGRWFEGYARDSRGDDYVGASKRAVLRDVGCMKNVIFSHGDYSFLTPLDGTVVYCDPPYANTKPYSGTPQFNSIEFWEVMNKWRKIGAKVYVSSYAAPEGWNVCWEQTFKRNLRSNSTVQPVSELLFI